jgi:hypothetical protein
MFKRKKIRPSDLLDRIFFYLTLVFALDETGAAVIGYPACFHAAVPPSSA